MRVYSVRSVEPWAGTGAAANGFIVAATLVAEDQVVHSPLACSDDLKWLEQQIHQPLTRLDIAANHRWSLGGVVRKFGVE